MIRLIFRPAPNLSRLLDFWKHIHNGTSLHRFFTTNNNTHSINRVCTQQLYVTKPYAGGGAYRTLCTSMLHATMHTTYYSFPIFYQYTTIYEYKKRYIPPSIYSLEMFINLRLYNSIPILKHRLWWTYRVRWLIPVLIK